MSDLEFAWCMSRLGILPQDLSAIFEAASRMRAEKALEDLKARAKKNYRVASRELHPDVTGGDEVKASQFRSLTEAMHKLTELRLPDPTPTKVRWTIRIRG